MQDEIKIDVHGKLEKVYVKIQECEYKNKKFQVYKFGYGLKHSDYHYIEQNNLVYVYTDDSGNDYWDMDIYYVKKEDEKIAQEYFEC